MYSFSVLGIRVFLSDEKAVEFMLKSLKWTKEPVSDRELFFSKIGVDFKMEWLPEMARHPLLTERTQYQNRSVLRRLVEELEMESLRFTATTFSQYVQVNQRKRRHITRTFKVHFTAAVTVINLLK